MNTNTSAPSKSWKLGDFPDRQHMKRAAITIGVIFAVIWLVQFINAADSYGLNNVFGIEPRELTHLPDIFTTPFLHMSWTHITNNSMVLIPVGFLAAYRSLMKFAWVTVAIIIVSGLFVWLAGPGGEPTVGASGVIAGWLGYVILRGWFERCGIDLIAGVISAFLFLSLFQFLPNGDSTSWQGHLSGLIVGMACAYFLSERSPVKVRKHIADVNASVQEHAEEMHVQEKLTEFVNHSKKGESS